MLKKVQIFKALDIEIKKQKGPSAIKESYRGHHSLKEELSQPGISVIAEVAGGNPLRGQVRENYRASTHAKSLVENGARVLCVATDRFLYFGEDKHLPEVRTSVKVPLLRQDFIFEEYQIEESKILGADAIFLMAALLEPERLVALRKLALAKGLDVVVQVASEADLKRALDAEVDIICILGRDLNTWEPSWERALELMKKVPEKKCFRMIEAGVTTLAQIQELESMGVHGVIVGDPLLDEFYPGKRLAQILSGIEPTVKKPVKPKAKPDAISAVEVASKAGLKKKISDDLVSTSEHTSLGVAEIAALPPSTSLSHTARKGKKESQMANSQIDHNEEANPPVDGGSSSPAKAVKKTGAKKAAPKKAAAKKAAPKKAAAKKPAPKKAVAKKPVAKKAVAKKPVVKKAAAKKPVVKKAVAKKPVAKKAVAKKPVAKKAVAKKPVAKKAVAKKPVVKKALAKKPVVKKAVAKKPVVKKAVAKKPAKKATKK